MQTTLKSRLDMPIDQETVVENLGDVEIDAPTGDSETVAEILNRDPTEVYDSAEDVYYSILSNLDEVYVGRKFYDDRGPNPMKSEVISF